MIRKYQYYRKIFKDKELPLAFVDLDLFDENVRAIIERAGQKRIRVASKSIRCTHLIKRILDSSPKYQGIMCFTLPEAVFLSQAGFDDLLAAYPCCQPKLITSVCEEVKKGKSITLMLDSAEHVKMHQHCAEKCGVVLPVCIDIDMSSTFPGLHFGVWRSGVFNANQASALYEIIRACPNLKLDGIMGYEAQIAGVADNYPGQTIKNTIVRLLKKKSIKSLAARREEAVKKLIKNGAAFRFVNGGGTGSLESTGKEDAVTEVTVGSGFYSSALFDNYSDFRHLPSAGFAIEIVRKPRQGVYTCHGGGYTASGAIGQDKQPVPYLPEGAMLTKNEGAGEVQTPVIYNGNEHLNIGYPIFMRHSKAGELCERFNSLWLVSDGKIVDEAKTYRGEGKCFL